jgi:hypothetical protein
MANIHWTNTYIGKPHTPTYDCAELCIEVQREQYHREVALPNRLFYEPGQNRNGDIQAVISLFEPVEIPQDGDIALMANGRLLNHVGIYVILNGREYILHNLERVGTILQKVRDIHKYTLKIQGYYRIKDDLVELKDELDGTNRTNQESAISC